MKTGIELIAEERATHNKRGYTSQHDKDHDTGELADMAAIYSCTHRDELDLHTGLTLEDKIWGNKTGRYNRSISWRTQHPDRITELVKAGALIAAEIDRLLHEKSNQ